MTSVICPRAIRRESLLLIMLLIIILILVCNGLSSKDHEPDQDHERKRISGSVSPFFGGRRSRASRAPDVGHPGQGFDYLPDRHGASATARNRMECRQGEKDCDRKHRALAGSSKYQRQGERPAAHYSIRHGSGTDALEQAESGAEGETREGRGHLRRSAGEPGANEALDGRPDIFGPAFDAGRFRSKRRG